MQQSLWNSSMLDLVIFHAVECLSCDMMSPFCQPVKEFSSPPVTTKFLLHELFSDEIFATRIFSNLWYLIAHLRKEVTSFTTWELKSFLNKNGFCFWTRDIIALLNRYFLCQPPAPLFDHLQYANTKGRPERFGQVRLRQVDTWGVVPDKLSWTSLLCHLSKGWRPER